ncbi:MAG: ATP-binding protein [Treponema sp.]|nr:ATP-binding protein [Treponema sp.]
MSIINNEVINKRIRRKFSLPLIMLTTGCCLVVLIFYILLFKNELNSSMYSNVDIAAMVAEHEIDILKANGRIAAMGIANDTDLIEAVINNDRGRIEKQARTLRTIAQVDYCTILDKDGIVLVRTHEPDVYGDSLAHLPHVKQALKGQRESYVAQGVTIDLGVYSGTPIYDDNRNFVGIVSLGFKLSNPKLVSNLKAITMCEISMFRNDERIATTISADDDPFSTAMKLPVFVSDTVLAGNTYSGRLKIAGHNAIGKYIPIIGADNDAVGMIGIGYYTAKDDKKIFIFIIVSIIVTLVIISICIFLARFVLSIVERRLGEMMNEVRKADEMVRAVTEEKNMLANIKDIMNALEVMIFVTDPKTDKILFMNESMKKHYGIDDNPIGKICYKVLQRGNVRCDYCPCIKLDNAPDKAVIWDERAHGTNSIYRRVDRYINWTNGEIVHIQHSVDMTELIIAKEAAESSNRSKGYFLAQMSHEIRTPMNAILGISEIQLMDKNLPPDALEGYRKIHESGNLLVNIINDILDFSKIDAGKLEIFLEKYDVPSLINDTVQLNRMRFEGKLISFIINLNENTPHELIGDELRIKQILYNLLSNAFKYTEVGEVELSVYAQEGESDEQVMIVFCVRDTGQGMTENQVARIFDEYSRFNMDTNRSISGTGLGMSITKRLIDMMNGEISVESKPGEGSVFIVRLPQIRCGDNICGSEVAKNLREFNFKNISLERKSEIIHEHMPYGKVLIVDDVESNLLVAKGLLMPYGLYIDTANSGFEAIEKIENDKNYDIVFMDHMMPKMDGLKTTKILRSMGYTRPIVALTANAVIGQEEMFLANGFDGFISKPIDSRELNHILIELIRNKKLLQENVLKESRIISGSDEIATAAMLDINNAVTVLKNILPRINTGGAAGEDMELFITTVHGIKSALSNIGESALANTAFKLERAGNEGDTVVIMSETMGFIYALGDLTEKIKQLKLKDNWEAFGEISHDNRILLNEGLNTVKKACKNFAVKEAKAAINDLKQKAWPYEINEILNEIAVYIVRGEYAKVEVAIDKADKILSP